MSELNHTAPDETLWQSKLLQEFGHGLGLNATLGSRFKQELAIPPIFQPIYDYARQQGLTETQTLLTLISSWQLYQQSGFELNQIESLMTSTAPPQDSRSTLSIGLQQLFDTLTTRYRNEAITRFTLAQWFAIVIERQQILPIQQVSEFLTNLPKLFRPVAHRVLSLRAQHYASQQSQYDWLVNSTRQLIADHALSDAASHDYWDSINLATQTYWLKNLRQQQPQAAINWLQQVQDSLKTEQLRDFLPVLQHNLNHQDAHFLQAIVSQGRSQQIRLLAASLLMQLPESPYYQGMQVYFLKTVQYDSDKGFSVEVNDQSLSEFENIAGINLTTLHGLQKADSKQKTKALLSVLASLVPLGLWQQLSPDFASPIHYPAVQQPAGLFRKLINELTGSKAQLPIPSALIVALKQAQHDSLLQGFIDGLIRFQDHHALQLLLSLPIDHWSDTELKRLPECLPFASTLQQNRIIQLIVQFYLIPEHKDLRSTLDLVITQLGTASLQPYLTTHPVPQQAFSLDQSVLDDAFAQLITYTHRKTWDNTSALYQLLIALAQPQQLTAYAEYFNDDEQALWQLRQQLFAF